METRQLEVGDMLFPQDDSDTWCPMFEIHRVTPKYAIHNKASRAELWFRRELCKNNKQWKTRIRGEKIDTFILNGKLN